MPSDEEAKRTALDDIVNARCPQYNPLTKVILKMMVLDVLHAHFLNQMRQEKMSPKMEPAVKALVYENAARTQVMMDTHGVVKIKQKQMGDIAKQIAAEIENRFYSRVIETSNGAPN